MIEQAIVDAHDESEQVVGFYSVIDDSLAVPFATVVLGVSVPAEAVEWTDDEWIVAVCTRDESRQRIPITDLPLLSPPPVGAEWIAAYRRWLKCGGDCGERE